MNATLGTWKAVVAGVLAALAQTAATAEANNYRPVSATANRPATAVTQPANAPVYGPAPLAPAAKPAAAQTASNGEQKTAFWGCWDPCYTRPVCRPVYPSYPTYPSYPYGYGTSGYGVPTYGVPGYGYGTGYGAGYSVPGYGVPNYGVPGYGVPGYGVPGYGVPGYGGFGMGVSGTVPSIAAPLTVPTYGSPVLGSPSVLPAVAPVNSPIVAPSLNPVYPGVAPLAPVAPYSPFYGSKDKTRVNAKVPADVSRVTNNSPYFK